MKDIEGDLKRLVTEASRLRWTNEAKESTKNCRVR